MSLVAVPHWVMLSMRVLEKLAGVFIPYASNRRDAVPTKSWAQVLPPSIARVSDTIVSVATGSSLEK